MIRKKRQRKITNKTLLIGKSRLKQFDSRAPEIEPKRTVPRTSHHCKHDVTPENTQGIQGVRQKAWRIRKLLPENTSKRDAVLDEVVRMEKIDTGVRRKLQYEKRTSLTKEVIKLTKLKAQRDFSKHEQVVECIKKKYKSLRAAHNYLKTDINWKRWHSICKPKKELHLLRRISQKEKQEILNIYNDPSVTITLPFKRHAKKAFMIVTISEAYQKYIMKKKLSRGRILSVSSFYKLKPKSVKVKKAIPYNICTCDVCSNYSLTRDALIANSIKGISRRATEAACITMCREDEEDPMECDVIKYDRDCIFRNCNKCDQNYTLEKIKSQNPKYNWNKTVTWHRWHATKKIVNGKECSGFEKVRYSGTAEELLKSFAKDSVDMPRHLLHQEWQRRHYCDNRMKLRKGDVLMVIDFAKNYAHVAQDEPQSAHWDRRQTTMHPIAVTFRCPEKNCNDLVTLEIVCFTEDLKHDSYAVNTFEEAVEQYLHSSGVPVKFIYQWSDNCTKEYKSKYAFDFLSKSKTPKMRNFYGEKHGKSAADGIIGRLKMKVDQDVRAGADIENIDKLYDYCLKNLETPARKGCHHYRRHYILIQEIKRPERITEPDRIKDTLKLHSIRSTGQTGVVEKRESSCMCDGCLEGLECQNSHMVLGWEQINLYEKRSTPIFNEHWPKNPKHNTRERETETVEPPTKRRRKMRSPIIQETPLVETSHQPTPSTSRRNPQPRKKQSKSWIDIGADFSKCKDYHDVEEEVEKVKLNHRIVLPDTVQFPIGINSQHDISVDLYPKDAPKGYVPMQAFGDGNCFPRTISLIAYGDQERYKDIRPRLVVEAVKNKDFYLDNQYLNLDSTFDIDLVEYYSITSEHYTTHARTGEWSRETIERIYEAEVVSLCQDGSYCSMWQLFQASNILGRPVMSIFPTSGMIEEFRCRTNRLAYPIRIHLREKHPVGVMWTKTVKSLAMPNHFVPIFKV